jgi:hypothetical protein
LKMEKTSKRGKIPQDDWPSIISRYEAGETLASIARTYDCSPPAISYIVSRTRARNIAGEGSVVKPNAFDSEPQLVKTALPVTPTDTSDGELMNTSDPPEDRKREATPAADASKPSEGPAPSPSEEPLPPANSQGNGLIPRTGDTSGGSPVADAAPGAESAHPQPPYGNGGSQPLGEQRRTLHLSLSPGNGAAPHSPTQTVHNPNNVSRRPNPSPGVSSEPASPAYHSPDQPPAGIRESAVAADPSRKIREGGAFLDQALRERINDDITAFLAAFDAALDHDTVESRTGLREATDRLLRAGARTRIELERLEARQPLSSGRDAGQRPFPMLRPR